MHAVENRTVIMIGATTENPYFEVNSALLSRGRVVELEHLKDEDIATLIERALEAPQGLGGKFSADEDTVKTIWQRVMHAQRLRRSSLRARLP